MAKPTTSLPRARHRLSITTRVAKFDGLVRAAADLSPAERAVVARYLDRVIAVIRAFFEAPPAR